MDVYELKVDKGSLCNTILRALPQWFGIENAILKYVKDVDSMPVLTVDIDSFSRVGLLALHFHNEYHAEIYVMGVLSAYQGQGVGKALVREAEHFARLRGAKYLTVKTVSESSPNYEYGRTRKFYASVGFIPLEEFKTLWDAQNPCLLMIKNL